MQFIDCLSFLLDQQVGFGAVKSRGSDVAVHLSDSKRHPCTPWWLRPKYLKVAISGHVECRRFNLIPEHVNMKTSRKCVYPRHGPTVSALETTILHRIITQTTYLWNRFGRRRYGWPSECVQIRKRVMQNSHKVRSRAEQRDLQLPVCRQAHKSRIDWESTVSSTTSKNVAPYMPMHRHRKTCATLRKPCEYRSFLNGYY